MRRASIEELPSGALSVRVYAGINPLSGGRHYLTELVKAGPGRASDRYGRHQEQAGSYRLRYTVESLLELLTAGSLVEELMADYPDLEMEEPRFGRDR